MGKIVWAVEWIKLIMRGTTVQKCPSTGQEKKQHVKLQLYQGMEAGEDPIFYFIWQYITLKKIKQIKIPFFPLLFSLTPKYMNDNSQNYQLKMTNNTTVLKF